MEKFRLKKGFVQRCVGGEYMLIPVGAENIKNYNGIITINRTTSFLCDLLKDECSTDELAEELTKHFQIDKKTATEDVLKLIEDMQKHHMLEEN